MSPQAALVRGCVGKSRPSMSLTAAMNLPSLARPLRSIMPRLVISRMSTARSFGASRDWSALSNLGSDILPAPFLVVEDGIGDLRPDHLALEREGERLAQAGAPVLDERHGDRPVERRRIVSGGDLADHLHRRLVPEGAHGIGAVG